MRLLTGVDPHVTGQTVGFSEQLLTNTALMKILTGVDPHVGGQFVGSGE